MIWGFQNEHQAMQDRFYCDSLNTDCNRKNPQRSARKTNQAALGLIMEVVSSIKTKRFTAFQPTGFSYALWDIAKEKMVSIEHRGYVCDAESAEEAAEQLISMVPPTNYDLGERMTDRVKNIFGVKS